MSPDTRQAETDTRGSAATTRSITGPEGFFECLSGRARAPAANAIGRPITAAMTIGNFKLFRYFIVTCRFLLPLRVEEPCVGHLSHQIHFALISRVQKLRGVGILRIFLHGGPRRRNSLIHDGQIVLVLNLKSGSHWRGIRFNRRIKSSDGLDIALFTRQESRRGFSFASKRS